LRGGIFVIIPKQSGFFHKKGTADAVPYHFQLFPLFFVVLLWFIYALNIILNGNFEPTFQPII